MLPVALGLALLGVGGVVGPSVIGASAPDDPGRFELTALPADAPDQGLVYEGLKPAAANALCAGSYVLFEETCTHGPDRAPTGLAVGRDVAPVTAAAKLPSSVRVLPRSAVPGDGEIARELGGSALTPEAPALIPDPAPGNADFVLGPDGVACEGDGQSGKRVQALYLYTAGGASRYGKYVNSFRTWAGGVDAIFDASAGETGGSRHVRYLTTADCTVAVSEVELPAGSLDSFAATVKALGALGYNRTDRKYLMFADTNVYCGIGTYVDDQRPGRTNRNNAGPSYARVDSGCWSSAMAALELTHVFGAVLNGAPNGTGAGGCRDDFDLLCGADRANRAVRQACPKSHEVRLDCGHDDYFDTNPEPGSFLDTHWNVALSDFLLRSDGGDDIPDVPGAVTPDPTTSPSTPATTAPATPDPSPSSASPSPSISASTPAGDTPAAPSPTPSTSAAPLPGVSASPGAQVAVEPAAFEQPHAESGVNGSGDQDAGAPEPETGGGSGVQAVLEIRDATSMSARLTWSAASDKAKYQVWVDGKPVATTKATRARLIGLKPDATYRVEITSKTLDYHATGTARTAPAARPVQNSYFVLANALTGGAADLYAARTADGTPATLAPADGGNQQQWQLVPAAAEGSYTLVSRASGKCLLPLGGVAVAGAPLVQGDCASAGTQWRLQASDYGFTLRSGTGDLAVGVGSQRFGWHRVLTLQPDTGQRHQSWTAVPN
ncbi:RICIN domain-containing protein [Actinoplanes oblitus]|uniref:RICIN domain-containing protein n=1 Tax=Actinoplanes oblitus TaxID=3040509 RepID=A0ABY8WEH7_9ACTN|nr:RICIN domain-containing protein [Actinoplanes oblitus]WIM94769.1 RICIN domain-containing protein [Actinoplanes oblitus]